MAYAQMDSPLPGLTVSPSGCRSCGMRGPGLGSLGDDSTDTVDTTDLTLAPVDTSETLTPIISPLDTNMIAYPDTIGTEFTSNGDGTYTNIQTGQSVPMTTAQQITAATTGSATAGGVATTSAPITGTIVDPNTGATISTNNLTAAAQALNSAGQLITAAGKLTAQGQALLNAGNLYNPATVSTTPNLSTAMASLSSFLTGSTLVAGVPNIAVLGIGIIGLVMVSNLSAKKGR